MNKKPTCINGAPDEGIEPIYYCEQCNYEEENELPCYREKEEGETWWCVNDHTGCLYNNGHNECMHSGNHCSPLSL